MSKSGLGLARLFFRVQYLGLGEGGMEIGFALNPRGATFVRLPSTCAVLGTRTDYRYTRNHLTYVESRFPTHKNGDNNGV